MSFLALFKGANAIRNIGLVIGAVVLIGLAGYAIKTGIASFKETAEESGAAKAVTAGHETTLGQIGAANEAANEIRNDVGFAKYCQCVQSASEATVGNCKRYIKDKSLLDNGPTPSERCAGGERGGSGQ